MKMKVRQVYKCEICGNVVEVLNVGGGELFCCGQPMKLMEEQTADTSTEKHVPFIERVGDKYVVKVGETVEHPMQPNHYIQWIELEVDGMLYRKYLKPTDKPMAEFYVPEGQKVSAREYCNLHGLWEGKL